MARLKSYQLFKSTIVCLHCWPRLTWILSTKRCLGSVLFVSAQKTVYDPNAVLREGKGYEAIEISDGIDLYISYGEEAIAVSASEDKHRDKIRTVVENGVLKISYGDKGISWNSKSNLKAYLPFQKITALATSGGSDINV